MEIELDAAAATLVLGACEAGVLFLRWIWKVPPKIGESCFVNFMMDIFEYFLTIAILEVTYIYIYTKYMYIYIYIYLLKIIESSTQSGISIPQRYQRGHRRTSLVDYQNARRVMSFWTGPWKWLKKRTDVVACWFRVVSGWFIWWHFGITTDLEVYTRKVGLLGCASQCSINSQTWQVSQSNDERQELKNHYAARHQIKLVILDNHDKAPIVFRINSNCNLMMFLEFRVEIKQNICMQCFLWHKTLVFLVFLNNYFF